MKSNTSVDDKLKLALKIIDNPYLESDMFTKIYSFTTENMVGYLQLFDFKDKSFLTVGSSGDQTLNAILGGCNRAHIIDICPFAEEYFYLKMAAILTLTRKEFLDFFSLRQFIYSDTINKNAFNIYTYRKIRSALSNDSVKEFWNIMFRKYSGLLLRQKLFNTRQDSPANFSCKVNNYLVSDEEYNKLKKVISDAIVSFSIGDIFKTEFNLDESYDNVNFSNLITYNMPEDMIKLYEKVIPFLNNDGKMLMAYLYGGISSEYKYRRLFEISQTIFVDSSVTSFEAAIKLMNSTYSYLYDSAIIYKKSKKI